MTAEGFLGQLFVAINVDTSGLANAATEMNAFQQKVITTSKMVNASTAQAANISDGRLKQSYNAESGYIKQKITANNQWQAQQEKWGKVESQYYAQQAASQNKALNSYNTARKLGNSQESQYYRQQAQEAAAAEKAMARSTQGMGISLNSLSNNLYRFGTFATMAFTLPLAALATLGVKSSMELEQIKQKTVALANVSQEQMDAWSGAITRIGIATNASSKVIAQALYFTASAGVDNASAMKLVEYAAKGSAAGLGETDTIAKLLTYTYNAYGKEAFNAAKRMDELTVAVREGAAEATDFANVMGDLIPIAAQIGVTFADLGGMLAGMTQIGLNAHKSATALRQIMMEMVHPSKQAEKALDAAAKKMGDMSIASINLSKTVEKEGLFPVLQKLKTVSETMGPLFLPTVFDNIRSFNGLMAMIGPNMDKVQEIIKKTKTEVGAFDKAFSIMTQTSEFKLGQFKKAWELAMLGLGDAIMPRLLPKLNSLKEMITDMTHWFATLDPVLKTVFFTFGEILAILGPLAIASAGLVRLWAILQMASIPLIGAINGIGAAFVWLSAIMLANPWVATAAAIVLLGAALYGIVTSSVEFMGATDDLIASKRMIKEITDKATESVLGEKIAIEQYLSVFNGYNASNEQKASALKKINALSPEYLGNLKEEDIGTQKAKDAIDSYTRSLELNARGKELLAAKDELIKNRMTAVAHGDDKALGWFQLSEVMFLPGLNPGLKAAKMSLDNATKSSNEFQLALLKLNEEIDYYNNNAIVKSAARTKELADAMTAAKKEIQDLFIKYREAISSDQIADDKPLQDYLQKLREIALKTSLFGTELKGVFDAVSETLSAKKTYLDSLIEKGGKATDVMKKLRDEIIKLQAREEYSKSSKDLMPSIKTLPVPFDNTLKASSTQDRSYRGLVMSKSMMGMIIDARKQVEYQKELEKIQKSYEESLSKNETNMISSKMGGKMMSPWKMEMDDLKSYVKMLKESRTVAIAFEDTSAIDEYNKKIEKALNPIKFQAWMQKFNQYVQTIGQGINELITSYVSMLEQQQKKATDFMTKRATAEGQSAEQIAKQQTDIDAEYNKKKRQAAIATALINGALAISNIIANTPGSVLNPLSWIGIGIAAAATAAQIAVISGAQMAEGGIVPSGYRNDTYPALLSSGEVVVPPHKLPSMLGSGKQQIILKGELVARGKDLVYVFQQQNILRNSY